MTSISVTIEQEIANRRNSDRSEINCAKHYLNFVMVRTFFRGVFTLLGKLMVSQSDKIKDKSERLELALHIFAAISLYFSIHGLCCFDEFKV